MACRGMFRSGGDHFTEEILLAELLTSSSTGIGGAHYRTQNNRSRIVQEFNKGSNLFRKATNLE